MTSDLMEAREIIRLTEVEGPQGVLQWISDHAELFHSDSRLVESAYDRVRTESIGAALLFLLALRKSNLLPPALARDLECAERADKYLWVTGVCHVSVPSVVERVRNALESGDVLFGWSYPCYGGGTPATPLITGFQEFERIVKEAGAGDHFRLASLRRVASQMGVLEPTVAAARDYLRRFPGRELWVLRTAAKPPELEILWSENRDDPTVELWFQPSEGLCLVPLREDLEFCDTYFVSLCKPDGRGAVPLLGYGSNLR
jgi:hypothetical protein